MRRTKAIFAVLAIVVGLLVVTTPVARAAPKGFFNPEQIISDAQFFDSGAMSEAQIQQFFQSTSCNPSPGAPCLKDFTQTTQTRADAGENQCGAYEGASSESAARIIAKVAKACGISPRVLIVLMQKEQSLVTSPTTRGYQYATGANCPDTPQGCDPAYSGFFIQVYGAAWQFRNYGKYPGSFNHRIGPTFVRYSPDAGCGGTTINIRNQATVNLYNYTPYQPNAAALANLYGQGDACSTYGNRNFWRIFFDWFGSPTDSSPLGTLENVQPVPGGIGVWGWALDVDTTSPVIMHVYVDGAFATGAGADVNRPDIGQRFAMGNAHGFGITVPAQAGAHEVCVYALNVGAGQNTLLGCAQVTVRAGDPVGAIENIQQQPGGIGVWGHAVDPDTSDPIFVHIYMDGQFAGSFIADARRPDLAGRYPGNGDRHGFGAVIAASTGVHRVCAYGINVLSGSQNSELGCASVTVGGNPVGSALSLTPGLQSVTVSGWAVDPDTSDPIWLHIYVDGAFSGGVYADRPRDDLGIYQPYGQRHGYEYVAPAGSGIHRVCAYALNVGTGTSNTEVGCSTVEVGGSPVGRIENGQPGFGSIGVWGWAYDPDIAGQVTIHTYLDGVFATGSGAGTPRPDVDSIPAAYGDDHGFGQTFRAAPGTHEVCSFALNVGTGSNTQLGCFVTTVSGAPVGAVENIQTVNGGLGVWGHAVDPDTTGPINVHVYLDGSFAGGFTANQPRSDLATRYPGFGAAHAFGGQIAASPGAHEMCVYAINTPSGINTNLSCSTVVRQ